MATSRGYNIKHVKVFLIAFFFIVDFFQRSTDVHTHAGTFILLQYTESAMHVVGEPFVTGKCNIIAELDNYKRKQNTRPKKNRFVSRMHESGLSNERDTSWRCSQFMCYCSFACDFSFTFLFTEKKNTFFRSKSKVSFYKSRCLTVTKSTLEERNCKSFQFKECFIINYSKLQILYECLYMSRLHSKLKSHLLFLGTKSICFCSLFSTNNNNHIGWPKSLNIVLNFAAFSQCWLGSDEWSWCGFLELIFFLYACTEIYIANRMQNNSRGKTALTYSEKTADTSKTIAELMHYAQCYSFSTHEF